MWYEIQDTLNIPAELIDKNPFFHPASATRSFVAVDNDNNIRRYLQVSGTEELTVVYREVNDTPVTVMNGLRWHIPQTQCDDVIIRLVHRNDENYTQQTITKTPYTLEMLAELYMELHWFVLRIAEGPDSGIRPLSSRDTEEDYSLRIFEREVYEKQGVKIKFVDYIYFDDCAPRYDACFTERVDDNEDTDTLISAIFREEHRSREKLRFYVPSLNEWVKECRVVEGRFGRWGLWETELSILRQTGVS